MPPFMVRPFAFVIDKLNRWSDRGKIRASTVAGLDGSILYGSTCVETSGSWMTLAQRLGPQ
jgi:hypothetical protein